MQKNNLFNLGDKVSTPDHFEGVVMKINKETITVVLPFPAGFREYDPNTLILISKKKGD